MKTLPTDVDVSTYLQSVEPAVRRDDALRLDEIFRDVTGFEPVLWGDSIVGYGRYDYTYKSGNSGTFLATGFAPRKAQMVLYIMPGYSDFSDILDRVGKVKAGKSCLYLPRLTKLDETALGDLIRAGLADLGKSWPVHPR
ncbi:MAG: DUF1801 domain-containing protein [Pseudomonadota bacterium]